MKYGRIFTLCLLVAFLLVVPEIALANSMAPLFAMVSSIGWVAMPVIILVEALFFYRRSVSYPIRLSLYCNLWSAFVGLFLAVATFPIMIGPPIEPYRDMIYLGAFFTVAGLLLHWWLSSHLECGFARWHKRWKNAQLPISLFYMANAMTYGLISLFFLYMIVTLWIDAGT